MGILNITPDSFADGGRYIDAATAVEAGIQMAADGADIVDVGGESTRPGAEPLPEAEELRRVIPVVEGLAARVSVPISIDTYKARVAREAVAAGATIVNDVSGLQYDAALGEAAASSGAALILMHTRGRSSDAHRAVWRDVVGVAAELASMSAPAAGSGASRRPDPGIASPRRGTQLRDAGPPRDAGRARPADPVGPLAQVVPEGGHRRRPGRRARVGDRRGRDGERPLRRTHRPRPRRATHGGCGANGGAHSGRAREQVARAVNSQFPIPNAQSTSNSQHPKLPR
jgi:hypothetical protein